MSLESSPVQVASFIHPIAVRARHAVTELVGGIDGALAVLVTTADGFPIAIANREPMDANRLAAIVSSFASLGEAASSETRIGRSRCLVIDSSEGRMVVRCMTADEHPLVVAVLASNRVLLGLVLAGIRDADRLLNVS